LELLNLFPGLTTLIAMRPLFHPSIEEITVEGILHALSDPVRVAIYADIVSQECSQNCSTFLTVSDKTIPKSTLSQHFRELREAGVVRAGRRGEGDHNHTPCADHYQPCAGETCELRNALTRQPKDRRKAQNM